MSRPHRAEPEHRRYDVGDMCLAFCLGFAACFLLFIYLLAQ